ncbi:DUF3558 domain-containing protein [Streptomyces profundus]|uniref:DUF3558 domain-containing protein n=1 Tax=Streptomyces profundus TaxID=2867410 RepID=UPI001D16CFF4|nr:DUF3558 domain-containing protein [Streptomyces sp. MA3_2.13]UED84928.1 DUF3558 domain-containing protein [Streptomyces sp. MA3_2.13]
MQVRARAAGAALSVAALILGASACSADLGGTEDTDGSTPSSGARTTNQQGRYSGLPEPCGSVSQETLAQLLPDADPEVYAGSPLATFDTGRRVGCEWRNADGADSQRLTVDFLRVVSYESDGSDDDQAGLDFEARAEEFGLTIGEEADDTERESPGTLSPTQGRPQANARQLDGIGHAAFLDDRLTSGDATTRRDVTLAFRNANVIVTVVYTVSTIQPDTAPDSARSQQYAETVAEQLAAGLDG